MAPKGRLWREAGAARAGATKPSPPRDTPYERCYRFSSGGWLHRWSCEPALGSRHRRPFGAMTIRIRYIIGGRVTQLPPSRSVLGARHFTFHEWGIASRIAKAIPLGLRQR